MSQPVGDCSEKWCSRKRRPGRSGLCQTHYERVRTGRPPRFPTVPLIEFAARKGIALEDMGNEVTLERMDTLCIDTLGVHPHDVYGDYYFTAA